MVKTISRRRALQLAAFSSMAGLAACAAPPRPAANPAPAPPAAPVTEAASPTASPSTAATAAAPRAATTLAPTPTAPVEQRPPDSAGNAAAYIAGMTAAADAFLATLDDDQRAKATYAFDDAERTRWHWTTPGGFPRNGLALREMSQAQKDAAIALLQSGLSPRGFQQSLDIMALQADLNSDPEGYYVTLFGAPGADQAWSWRWEGHHLSRHFTAMDGRVAVTPFFHGAWPTETNAGKRAMPREEDAARELVLSLLAAGRAEAVFSERSLTRHITANEARVSPLDPVGVPAGEMAPDQQALVREILEAYLGAQAEPAQADLRGRLEAAGFEEIHFGWAGTTEPRKPHYYRLQGPSFLLEFDNSRNSGTHIHSVWRDYDRDFGLGRRM